MTKDSEIHAECGHLWIEHEDDGVQMLCPESLAAILGPTTRTQGHSEWGHDPSGHCGCRDCRTPTPEATR